MARIAFFETKQWQKEYVQAQLSLSGQGGQGHEISFHEEELNEQNAAAFKDIEVAGIFIYSKITGVALQQLPNLKLVVTMSTGYDHIDLAACASKNVVACNVPAYGDNTVAEHTFALILSLSRHVHKSYVRTIHDNFSIEGLQGFDLQDKTIGVVGAGKIGLHVIKIAKGFGMHVLVFDKRRDPFVQGLLHFRYVDTMDELLEKSDIVTLHVPALPSTYHMMGKEQFAKMKKGALLINTARGTLVDTDALYDSLHSRHLGGAGLDVIEGEEMIKEETQPDVQHLNEEKLKMLFKDMEIFKMENVVFTPHNAFNSKEALYRILETTVENINGMLSGKPVNTLKPQ